MIKYSSVLGLPVICTSDGAKIGTVKDIVFCKTELKIASIILEKGSYAIKGRVIAIKDVINLGNDALIIASPSCLINYKKYKKSLEMQDKIQLRGFKIYTRSGNDLGVVQDIYFDYQTGKIDGVQVSDGFFQDVFRGRHILPFIGKVEVGNDNLLVDEDAVSEMTSTGGGLLSRLEKDKTIK